MGEKGNNFRCFIDYLYIVPTYEKLVYPLHRFTPVYKGHLDIKTDFYFDWAVTINRLYRMFLKIFLIRLDMF